MRFSTAYFSYNLQHCSLLDLFNKKKHYVWLNDTIHVCLRYQTRDIIRVKKNVCHIEERFKCTLFNNVTCAPE